MVDPIKTTKSERLQRARARRAEHAADGKFVGAGGKLFAPSTPLEEIPPFRPRRGALPRERIIAVNGIMTDVELHAKELQRLAESGAQVIGIHNSTDGLLFDLVECLTDKAKARKNVAIAALTQVIIDALEKGEPLHLMGHSQGAIIVACALSEARDELQAELGEAETQRRLGAVFVETLGGAANRYIDGPRYKHYVNLVDAVPMFTGIGAGHLNPFNHPGDGAEIETFRFFGKPTDLPSPKDGFGNYVARVTDRTVYGQSDVYVPEREKREKK